MAGTPRTFSRGSHFEAKAGENTGQGEPRGEVIEKTRQTNQRKNSEVSLTRSPSRLVGVLRLLPRLRRTRFRGCGLRDDRTWREGVLSLKHRRCNETKEYHRAQQSPHQNDWLPRNENPHGRTSGDEERLTITPIILRKKPDALSHRLAFFFLSCLPARACARASFRSAERSMFSVAM
jgi:hypothetical protein